MNKLFFALALLTPEIVVANPTVFTLSPYNGFFFNTFSYTADFGGGIAAGGSITIGNTQVADALLGEVLSAFAGNYTLVAGGTLTATNGQVATGNAYGGGPNNNFSLSMLNGSFQSAPGTSDPINFAAQQTSFRNLSSTLSHMASTGTCTFDGFATTTCTATAPGLNIINVSDPTILGTSRTVNINLGTNSYVILNVAGGTSTPDYMSNYGFNVYLNGVNQGSSNGDSTTTLAHNILFNYYQATGLDITSVMGSVLAPYAAVSGISSGQIDGTLVGNSFSGPTEFHNYGYTGTLPSATPEPSTYLMIAAGLMAFAGLSRKRSRR